MEAGKYTLSQFETALDAIGADLEEIILIKGGYVKLARGYLTFAGSESRVEWNSDGQCYDIYLRHVRAGDLFTDKK